MTNLLLKPVKSIVSAFEAQVEKYPDAPALSYRGQVLNYSNLNNHANQLANQLLQFGIRPGDRIGIDARRTDWFVIGILAILKTRGAYVPLDASFPPSRLKYMVDDCDLKFILCQTSHVADFISYGAHLIKMDDIDHKSFKNDKAPPQSEPDDSAYVMYTSGSTGQPKGVDVLNKGVTHLVCDASYVELGPTHRHLQLAPNGFDAATFEIWGALLNGGCCVIYPDEELSLESLGTTIADEKISVLWITSSLFNTVIDTCPQILSNVAQLLIGGEALSVGHVRKAIDLLPRTRLINGYGPTEATTFTCCYDITPSALIENTTIPIGKPINKAFVCILNSDGNPVSPGTEGELYIGGDGVARGYINKQDETANHFLPPLEKGRADNLRLYRSGDMVRELECGNIEFLGRIDQQVKIRGYRVEPAEVEAVLQRRTQYKNSAIVAYKTPSGTISLAAFIALRPDDTKFEELLLLSAMAEHLPKHCLPEKFIRLDSFPLTSNGKLDRQKLRQSLEGKKSLDLSSAKGNLTSTEQHIADIWRILLQEPEIISDDNFFHKGGNSLQAIQMISEIKHLLGVQVSLGKLFECNSLKELAIEVENSSTSQHQTPTKTVPGSEEFEASFGQHQMWLEHQFHQASSAYNVPVFIEFDGKLNLKALQNTLNTLFTRHDMLRASFWHDGNKLYVNCASNIPAPLSLSTELISLQSETSRVFSLSNSSAPLTLIFSKTSNNKYALLLNFHHILIDEWSIAIFASEFQRTYTEQLTGQKQLPPIEETESYRNFSDLQHDKMNKEIHASQTAYWANQLAGVNPVLNLKYRSRIDKNTSLCERVQFHIPNSLVEEMKLYASSEGTSLFTLLLSLYGTLLANSGCGTDFAIGTPVSLRDTGNFQNTIGYFLNTLAIRMRPQQNQTFSDFLSHVHDTVVEAIQNKDVPFEKLVEELSPLRDDVGRPFFQTLFSLQRSFQENISIPECKTTLTLLRSTSRKCALSLQLMTMPDGINGEFEYDPSLFDADYIDDLAEKYQSLLLKCQQNHELRNDVFLNENFTSEEISNCKNAEMKRQTVRASNDFTIALIQSWKKSLDIDTFDPNDNFFDLGGNSLSALKLASEIKRTTGAHIDLADIFRTQTFVKLLNSIEQATVNMGDLIVKLQEGTSEDKSLICLHGVTYYKNLAAGVGPEVTVYGLLAKEHQEFVNSLKAGNDLRIDIDAMSDRYVDLIRSVQPNGPYNLLGHSFGGFIAFEATKKLAAEEEKIGNLFLIDVLLPDASYAHWYQRSLKVIDLVRKGGIKNLYKKIFTRAAKRVAQTPTEQPLEQSRLARLTRQSYQQAMRNYDPTALDIPTSTLLIRAHETHSNHSKKEDFGWGRLLSGSFKIKDVDGDHLSCTSPPIVDKVGVHLRTALCKGEAQNRTQLNIQTASKSDKLKKAL